MWGSNRNPHQKVVLSLSSATIPHKDQTQLVRPFLHPQDPFNWTDQTSSRILVSLCVVLSAHLYNSRLIAYLLPADCQTGRQAVREANALISACHMIGLAGVLSNKALMSTFNCLHGFPCQINDTNTLVDTHIHTTSQHICPI